MNKYKPSLYDILRLPRTCNNNEIKHAYRTLSLIFHPDKNRSNIEEATEIFKQISTARDILLDMDLRREYDIGYNEYIKINKQTTLNSNNKNQYNEEKKEEIILNEWSLIDAIKNNDMNTINIILKDNIYNSIIHKYDEETHKTAILWAVRYNRYEILIKLLKTGANINDKDIYGWTPLFSAVHNGNIEIVKILLECGANINDVNNEGTTLFDICIKDNVRQVLNKYKQSKWNYIKSYFKNSDELEYDELILTNFK